MAISRRCAVCIRQLTVALAVYCCCAPAVMAVIAPVYYSSSTGNVIVDLSSAPGGNVLFFLWELNFDGFRPENYRPMTNSVFADVSTSHVFETDFNASTSMFSEFRAGAYNLGELLPAGLTQEQALSYFGPEDNGVYVESDIISSYGTLEENVPYALGLVYDGEWIGANQSTVGNTGGTGGIDPPTMPPTVLPGGSMQTIDWAESIVLSYNPANGRVTFDSSGEERWLRCRLRN